MEPEPADAAHTVAAGDAPVRSAAHAARPAGHHRRLVAAAIGGAAVLTAVWMGTTALLGRDDTNHSSPTSANLITVTPTVPLSSRDLVALVGRSPDFGPLADEAKRASCLTGLGYPSTQQILGAEPLQIDGRPTIVLVLPGERPEDLVVLAVAPTCSSVTTGLVADTTVRRP
ncbi:hypothetical protein MANY_38690 [Mycolicibacterium anyangense]|uniref:Anti-sigma-M factor RsmA n=1 Tax=Mycolicibacterium anyangense TaxID=1431246 RepID=A0A6N4WF16_9MYCO|nr:hypothetical protein [Mycolicibacterium anyangense]BBZ78532.1 hypothetical protein MANY_38690 [Mycolicibacterium anyangense]